MQDKNSCSCTRDEILNLGGMSIGYDFKGAVKTRVKDIQCSDDSAVESGAKMST